MITAPSSITIDEDTTFTFTGASAITFSDVDVGTDELDVTIRVTGGSWALRRAVFQRILIILSELFNQFLSLLEFTPRADFSGQASINITITDMGHNGAGGAMIDNKIITIDVTPVNDAPAISGLQAATITEGQVGASIETFTVSDIDTAGRAQFPRARRHRQRSTRASRSSQQAARHSASPALTSCGSRPAKA